MLGGSSTVMGLYWTAAIAAWAFSLDATETPSFRSSVAYAWASGRLRSPKITGMLFVWIAFNFLLLLNIEKYSGIAMPGVCNGRWIRYADLCSS